MNPFSHFLALRRGESLGRQLSLDEGIEPEVLAIALSTIKHEYDLVHITIARVETRCLGLIAVTAVLLQTYLGEETSTCNLRQFMVLLSLGFTAAIASFGVLSVRWGVFSRKGYEQMLSPSMKETVLVASLISKYFARLEYARLVLKLKSSCFRLATQSAIIAGILVVWSGEL